MSSSTQSTNQPEAANLVGVAGLGFMGQAITASLLEHGFRVVALDPDTTKHRLNGDPERLTRTQTVADLASCDFVIETITENLAAKQKFYEELEQHLGSKVPIASNTSGFPITVLQKGRKHPERFVGMHWNIPADRTRFLEIIRGKQTNDQTVEKVRKLALQLGKTPGIVNKDLPGFVANRLAYAVYREAIHLLEQGVADAESIDQLCRDGIGLWLPVYGPFRWMDITGGPALYATVMETILPTLNGSGDLSDTMRRMKEEKRLGLGSGEGFYSYEANEEANKHWHEDLQRHALAVWESSEQPERGTAAEGRNR